MRTKALLLSAAVLAAGLATSTAQTVYSVNAVGYVNLSLATGYNMISNPLNGTNNNLNAVIPVAPDGSQIYIFDPVTQNYFSAATYLGGWDVDYPLPPGSGAFMNVEAPTTITFVGEVMQGNLTNALSANFQIKSSQVPQSGGLTTVLGYTPLDGDVVYTFNTALQQFNQPFTHLGGGVWDPAEPVIAVGQAFFLQRSAAGSWSRTFSVN